MGVPCGKLKLVYKRLLRAIVADHLGIQIQLMRNKFDCGHPVYVSLKDENEVPPNQRGAFKNPNEEDHLETTLSVLFACSEYTLGLMLKRHFRRPTARNGDYP
jgi:hypothetical protein